MIHSRKPCGTFSWLVCLALCLCAAPASADVFTVSAAGQFGPDVIADRLAAPNALWALTFAVDSNPAAANADALGFDATFSAFSYMLNDAP